MKQYVISILFCLNLNLFSQHTIETAFSIPYGYEREIINEFHNWIISQSFMIDPAMGDEQHILLNPKTGNVWYDLKDDIIYTPEWTMNPKIIRFKQ